MLEQIRKKDIWTRGQLEAYQAASLSRLREYAYARSPFYRQFHRGLEGHPLQDLPVLTRSMLMEYFDELVTDRAIHTDAAREHMRHMSEADSTNTDNHVASDARVVPVDPNDNKQSSKDQRFLGRYWLLLTSTTWYLSLVQYFAMGGRHIGLES